jgi:hypothetical protein
MSDFEFFFSFYGLLLSLSVVEIATKLADWVGQRHRHRLSALTGLLAIFLLMDLSAFWMLAWGNREVIRVGWGLVFGGLAVAVVYFLAAALVFPRNAEDWATLDEHYGRTSGWWWRASPLRTRWCSLPPSAGIRRG